MVLKLRKQDLIPGLEVGAPPTFGDEVDAFSGAADEDTAAGVLEPEELCDRSAGFLIGRGSLLTQEVDATMDVGVLFGIVAFERLDDDRRLLGGRGVVEIG